MRLLHWCAFCLWLYMKLSRTAQAREEHLSCECAYVCVCSFMSCLSFSKPLPMMSTSSNYADWSSASALECQWETVTRQTFLCQDQAEPRPGTAKSYTRLAPRRALSYITICQRGTQIDTHLWHFTTSENTCFPTVIFNVHFSASDHQSLEVNPHAASR